MVTSRSNANVADLVERARGGQPRAVARLISLVENDATELREIAAALSPFGGHAQVVGLTGSPGVGKSTTTSAMVGVLREAGKRVGVLAVDPSSPFSGGALLGDRVRMQDHATDDGVFIRSMASRGQLGGLSAAVPQALRVLDAAGCDIVLIETVGVGQAEVEIASLADTTLLVVAPGFGDGIQAAKAGIIEIADIFVVNKADRPGADKLANELEVMLHMRLGDMPASSGHHGVSLRAVGRHARESARQSAQESGAWAIPVLRTIGQNGEGVEELARTLDRHRVYLQESGELSRRRRARLEERVRAVVERRLQRLAWRSGRGEELLAESLPALESGETSPYEVAERIVAELGVTSR